MSAAAERESVQCCASCGIAEIVDIKLKNCDECDLVRYCSETCQEDHRSQHKEECEKRAAELHDEILFKQPESTHRGDCPICCLPIPIDPMESGLYPCCGKRICGGCNLAHKSREFEGSMDERCPFCRSPSPRTEEESIQQLMKRIEANDPVAICHIGTKRCTEGDYTAGFEYYTKAASLGEALAHYQLSVLYAEGFGVEKDEKREQYHSEQAAIGGHPSARYNLGCIEAGNGRVDRAVKHWIIAAKHGSDDSLEYVKDLYKDGDVSKEDFAAALRGHHAAIVATKSPQREEALAFAKWTAEREGKRGDGITW